MSWLYHILKIPGTHATAKIPNPPPFFRKKVSQLFDNSINLIFRHLFIKQNDWHRSPLERFIFSILATGLKCLSSVLDSLFLCHYHGILQCQCLQVMPLCDTGRNYSSLSLFFWVVGNLAITQLSVVMPLIRTQEYLSVDILFVSLQILFRTLVNITKVFIAILLVFCAYFISLESVKIVD